MNQKHRVVKPFISVESFKAEALGALSAKSSIPVLPPANARLYTDGIFKERTNSASASTSTNIIFTGVRDSSIGGQGALNGNEKVALRRVSEIDSQHDHRNRGLVSRTEDTAKAHRGIAESGEGCRDKYNSYAVPVRHTGSQTELDGAAVEDLRLKLADAHRRMQTLQNSRHHEVTHANAKISPRHSQQENDEAVVRNLRAALTSLQEQVESQKKASVDMQQRLSDAERINRLHENSKEENLRLLKLLNDAQTNSTSANAANAHTTIRSHAEAVSTLKKLYSDQSAAIQSELDAYARYVHEKILPHVTAITATVEKQDEDKNSLRLELSKCNMELSAAVLREQKLQENLDEERRQHAELQLLHEELSASVVAKTDAATATAHAVAAVLAKAAPAGPATPEKALRNQIGQYENLLAQLESKHKTACSDREKHFLRAQLSHNKVCTAEKRVRLLVDAHTEVIKTAKHSAHVKDLGRIAAYRELQLEKDRAESVMSHYKEVNNVLSFCLSTVETTLLESQPQIVIRVAEGRSRRLQALEQVYRRRNKDIEQRSAETCALGTAALESFQKKADGKTNDASQAWGLQLEELQKILCTEPESSKV